MRFGNTTIGINRRYLPGFLILMAWITIVLVVAAAAKGAIPVPNFLKSERHHSQIEEEFDMVEVESPAVPEPPSAPKNFDNFDDARRAATSDFKAAQTKAREDFGSAQRRAREEFEEVRRRVAGEFYGVDR